MASVAPRPAALARVVAVFVGVNAPAPGPGPCRPPLCVGGGPRP